jgi:hypothetical protein
MKITLEPTLFTNSPDTTSPKVIIDLPFDYLDLTQIMEYLVKPALIGYGFSREGIDIYFDAE